MHSFATRFSQRARRAARGCGVMRGTWGCREPGAGGGGSPGSGRREAWSRWRRRRRRSGPNGTPPAVQLRQGTLPFWERIAILLGLSNLTTAQRAVPGRSGCKSPYAAAAAKARGYRPVRRANRPRKHDQLLKLLIITQFGNPLFRGFLSGIVWHSERCVSLAAANAQLVLALPGANREGLLVPII